MKVCYVGGWDSIHLRRHALWLAQRGHQVDVVTWAVRNGTLDQPNGIYFWDARYLAPGVAPLHSTFPSIALRLDILTKHLLVDRFQSIYQAIEPDVIHGHFLTNTAQFVAAAEDGPKVLTAWGSDVCRDAARSAIVRSALRRALRRTDALVCVAKHLQLRLLDWGIRAKKTSIVPMGVDLETFKPGTQSETPPPVISTRTLSSIYDVGTLIEAVPHVSRMFPNIRFEIVGSGPLAQRLQIRAETLGVSGIVSFRHHVPHSIMPELLRRAAIYVSTSRSDGASVSLLEAMASGLAPVVTDIPANREWVVNSENGFLFPPGDHATLAERIEGLVANPDLIAQFGRRCRAIVESRADWNRNMQEVLAIYEALQC